jgi:hypothetical protein
MKIKVIIIVVNQRERKVKGLLLTVIIWLIIIIEIKRMLNPRKSLISVSILILLIWPFRTC